MGGRQARRRWRTAAALVMLGVAGGVAGLQVDAARPAGTAVTRTAAAPPAQASAAPTPSYVGDPIGGAMWITAGPDGALWFTDTVHSAIGRITTSGVVTEYTDPQIGAPGEITAGPDGALWFTRSTRGDPVYRPDSIGRITTSGRVTVYSDPGISFPGSITAGPDGALWFTNYVIDTSYLGITTGAGGPSIGRITTFVGGLVGSTIGLLPLRFLPGGTIREWSGMAWAGLFAVAAFALVDFVIRSPAGAGVSHAPLVLTVSLVVAFAAISVAFREYFAWRWRKEHHRRAHGFHDLVRELLAPRPGEEGGVSAVALMGRGAVTVTVEEAPDGAEDGARVPAGAGDGASHTADETGDGDIAGQNVRADISTGGS